MLNYRKGLNQLEKVAQKHQTIPINLSDTWKTDYNISNLDRIVRQYLNQNMSRIKNLETEKAEIEEQLKLVKGRIISLSLQRRVEEISNQIVTIKTAPEVYEKITCGYLSLYKKMGNVIYGPVRIQVIETYLTVIKKFYPHNITRDLGQMVVDKCVEHDVLLEPLQSQEDEFVDDRMYCPICQRVYDGWMDWSKITVVTKKKDYDVIANFEKILDQFEGKVIIDFPQTLWNELDEKVSEKGWKKSQMKKQDVNILLKETNNSNYYPHLPLISFLYCKIPLPDLTRYRSDLIDDYRDYCKVYSTIDKTRGSALNGLFIAWKLLEKRGYNGDLDSFKPSISKQTLAIYDQIWFQACEKLGWEFIPTV